MALATRPAHSASAYQTNAILIDPRTARIATAIRRALCRARSAKPAAARRPYRTIERFSTRLKFEIGWRSDRGARI